MNRYLAILFLIFASFLTAKNVDLDSLESTVIQYNREGKHKLSQQKLSDLLLSGDLSRKEEANILFLMAATYRSVNDYLLCIEYLNKSSVLAEKSSDDRLRMKIDYEFAFVYFDDKDYKKAGEAMQHLAGKNYKNTIPEDDSYILMQEGYLFLLDKKYSAAEKKYSQALAIMKRVNYCNLPIVLSKMMELYNRKNKIDLVENIYHKGERISDSCGILKYKVFLAAELERIYKENDKFNEAYAIGKNVDSLRQLENQGEKISEMHIMDVNYLEKRESLENEFNSWEKIGALSITFFLLFIIFYSFNRSRNLKTEKNKMKKEIVEMKENLHSYSQTKHLDEKFMSPELSIANSDQLTERQKELLKLMVEGLSNKEIAEKLFITESTVKYHIKNIYSILNLKDRKDLFQKLI